MKKTLLAIMAATTTVLSSSLTVFAAPEAMPDGTIFDAEYYAQNNPDVAAVLGTDKDALYQHYLNLGRAEGRKACQDGAAALPVSETDSTVIIEPGDENYIRVGYLATGFNYDLSPYRIYYERIATGEVVERIEPNTWTGDPAEGFVRKDWSGDIRYQTLKKEFLALAAQYGAGVEIRGEYSNFTYLPESKEDMKDFMLILDNLSIDLMKEGVFNTCHIINNPTDGQIHMGEPYEMLAILYANGSGLEDEYIYDSHPEIWNYYKK